MEKEVLTEKLKELIENSKYTDWGRNGDDDEETSFTALDEDSLITKILQTFELTFRITEIHGEV